MASRGQDVCEEFVIDVSPVVDPSRWPECCIYRVPKILRKVNEVAYTPKLISIGPLHHGNPELQDMEMQKLRYFRDFCNYRTNKSQKNLARIVEKYEEKIRHCYEETSALESREYVSMILLDAIFIIELFLKTFENKNQEFDYILSTPWLGYNIRHDLILLENQLPFFILEELFKKSGNSISNISFLEHACGYFHLDYSYISGLTRLGKEVKHFTDLQRYFLCSPNLKRGRGVEITHLLYSATKLDDAGVKFKAVTNKEVSERRLLDVEFKKNKCLEHCPWLNCSWILDCLPCLRRCFPCLMRLQPFFELQPIQVRDSSESFFRNVMAFEQCHYPLDAYVCNYFVLLDQLINTDKDVDWLVDKKIIVNRLGSNDALATLINKLGLEIFESNSCYDELCRQLNNHYENFWNRHMASLTSVYFRDFWRGSTTVLGLVVLVFTLWNFITIFSRRMLEMMF